MFNFTELRAKPGILLEISEDQYDHMLEVLPPIYGRGCFAMGEQAGTTSEGRSTWYWAAKRGTKFFGCYGTQADAEEAFRVWRGVP